MQLVWFELSALIALILLLRLRRQLDAKQAAKEQNALPPGHGLDTTPVQARLKEVRQDYRVAAPRPQRNPNHEVVAAVVRRSLRQLSYFRSERAGEVEKTERVAEEIEPHAPQESLG